MGLLEGRVALITGGVKGIGFAIAEAYLAEGAVVAVNGRNPDNGAEALRALGAGDRAAYLQGDVTVRSDVERIIDETVERFGKIDILVNNAGGMRSFGPVAEITDEVWSYTVDLNLNAVFWATRKVIPHLVGQGHGRIINISSLEGKYGMPMLAPYVAAKHGLFGLTKTVAKEVGRSGVTCNCLCPGLIPETQMALDIGEPFAAAMGFGSFVEAVEAFGQRSALGRTARVEECIGAAVLLASDQGSAITGVALSIDGGTAEY